MRRLLASCLCVELAALPLASHAQPAEGAAMPPLPPPPPSIPVPAPASVPPATTPPPVVVVHVDGADGATVEMQSAGSWATVCRAPCDQPLAVGPMYRVAGAVKPSRPFPLDGPPRQTVHVRGASQGGFVGGIVAVAVGGAFTAVGLAMGVSGVVLAADAGDSTHLLSANAANGLATAGWITLGVGVVTGVAGLVLLLSNLQTDATRDLTGAPVAPASADAWRFAPGVESAKDGLARPVLNQVTLLRGSF
jgi:hypothetical protein